MQLKVLGFFLGAGLLCIGAQTFAAIPNGKYDALERKLNIAVEEAQRLQGCEKKEKANRNASFLVAGTGVVVAVVCVGLGLLDTEINTTDDSKVLRNIADVGLWAGLITAVGGSCVGGYFFKESRAMHASRFLFMKEKLYKLDEENLVAIQDLEKNQKKLNEESISTLAQLKKHKEYLRTLKDEFELYGGRNSYK